MAQLGQVFNTQDLPENSGGDFSPIPAGWYTAKISEAELKTTKAGNGQYINVRYDITGPEYQGRVVFGMLNITNPSQKAEDIGRAQLGELLRAIGLPRIGDTDELIGHDVQIKTKIQKSEEYGDKNVVTNWKSAGGTGFAPSNDGVPFEQPVGGAQAENGGSKPPWAQG